MNDKIKRVVILGGGTAGWMTASYLAKAFGDLTVTVLEAPSIPRIGVGEATVPNLQPVFFDFLGLKEKDWMPECNASFKIAVKFINWCTPGAAQPDARWTATGSDHFYHPFGLLPECDRLPLSHYWVNERLKNGSVRPFDYACFYQPAIMDALRAPCWPDGTPATTYAWHFDAQLVADFLRRFSTETLSVRHVEGVLTEVVKDANGFITSLRTQAGDDIAGDLFVDCSGFRGLLINRSMGEPFLDMSDQLLCDSAVATAVPHDGEGVEPFTSAIAMPAGWAWKIPFLSRFGSGYVYSSQFIDQEEATEEFCRLWGLDPSSAFNHIRFRVGRNRRAWVKNCVGIGLSSCFLEPLESSGIYFISASIYQLTKHFPDKSFHSSLVDAFNREIETMFDDSKDFIQAHYYFSPRTDTPFWRANKELTLSSGIQEKVAAYRAGLPVNAPVVDTSSYYCNFEAEFRNFWTNGSYYCIFAGLGFLPDAPLPSLAHREAAIADSKALFDAIEERGRTLVAELPSTAEYLRTIHGVTADR
jgi:tryptophan halogenase